MADGTAIRRGIACCCSRPIVLGLWLCAWLLEGCAPATAGAGLHAVTTSRAETPGPTAPPQPSPSAQPPTPAPTLAPPASGWTVYLGINEVHGVAFAPDGGLWAATTGGVARWDVAAGTYTQYTTADGLASNYANDVALAPDGSLWVATASGVSRLEGDVWTSFISADGLAGNAAQSLAVTPAGEVWVGTISGVSRFDGRSWAGSLPGARTWKVAAGPDGSVWAANDGVGVSRYSGVDGTWITYGTEQGLPGAGVKTVAVAPDGDVWIYVGYDGVYRYDGVQWREVSGISVPWVCDIAFDAGGAAWIATCPGLHGGGFGMLAPRGTAWERLTSEQGLGSDTVFSVGARADGTIAAGTMLGLSVYQEGRWRTLMGGPARNGVTSVAVTGDGTAWLGSGDYSAYRAGGGVSRFDGKAWQYYLGNANVQVLAVDPSGGLWAGAGCELERWDGQAWTSLGGCDQLMGSVVDLAFGPDGRVWVASGMRLGCFGEGVWTFFDRNIHSIAVAPDGALWASGWRGSQGSEYTARFDGSTWVEYPGRKSGPAVTPDGQVWAVALDEGLMRFDGGAWSAYNVQYDAGIDPIGRLDVGPDGSLWAVGNGSLARLDGGTWQVYLGAGARAIAFAPDGSLWLGTENGVVHFSPGTVEQ